MLSHLERGSFLGDALSRITGEEPLLCFESQLNLNIDLGGVLASLLIALLQRNSYFYTEPKQVLLEHKAVPSDLLAYIYPGTSIANLRDMLGPPFAETERSLKYKFKNLLLEVDTRDGVTIDTLTLVLPSVEEADEFPIPPLTSTQGAEYVLGTLRLGEVMTHQDDLLEDTSSKHGAISVAKYFGNPGYYCNFLFGVFDGPGARYDGPLGPDDGSTLFGRPDDLIVNVLTISHMDADVPEMAVFDFYSFR
jgi:hypothetical protein